MPRKACRLFWRNANHTSDSHAKSMPGIRGCGSFSCAGGRDVRSIVVVELASTTTMDRTSLRTSEAMSGFSPHKNMNLTRHTNAKGSRVQNSVYYLQSIYLNIAICSC